MKGRTLMLYLCAVLSLALLVGSTAVLAVSATALLKTTLPTPRYGMGGFAYGDEIILVGGYDTQNHVDLNTTLAFDTSTLTFGQPSAILPTGLQSPSSVWNGTYEYLFGGQPGYQHYGTYSDKILRYSPYTKLVKQMNATIPFAGWQQDAVAISPYWVYLFGGVNNTDGTDMNRILSYDIINDHISVLPYTEPYPLGGSAAFYHNGYVYFLGGTTWDGSMLNVTNRIMRFSVASGQWTLMPTRLPFGITNNLAAGVQVGNEFIVFGGGRNNFTYTPYSQSFGGCQCSFSNQILEYFPDNDTLIVSNATLPTSGDTMTAVLDHDFIYVFGGAIYGWQGTNQVVITNQIDRYEVTPEGAVLLAGGSGLTVFPASATAFLLIAGSLLVMIRKGRTRWTH